MTVDAATRMMSLTTPVSTYASHCWTELHVEPTVTAIPRARSAFFSGLSFIRRFRTQADNAIAQTRWSMSVKGLIIGPAVRLKNRPAPETSSAADEETSVRLSHRGLVSRRDWVGKCNGS